MTDAVALCYCFYRSCRGAVIDELGEHCSVSDIATAFDARCAADLAPPSDRSLAGGPVTFHLAAAVAAWSVLWHWVTEPPLLSTLRQPHRGLSDDGPDIRLQSIYFQR